MTAISTQPVDFSSISDPQAEREAAKYAQPIPSRELILQLLQHHPNPLSRSEIAQAFGLESDSDLEALRRRLRAMERDGQILYHHKHYLVVNQQDLISGRILGHADGFGFLKPDDGSEDLFLSPREMRVVMHNDRVLVRVVDIDRRGRREATVVEVLERHTHQLVGRLYSDKGFYFVIPEQNKITHEILIPKEGLAKAKKGQIVVVKIIQQPSLHHPPLGQVIEILGKHLAPGMEIDIAIRNYELPYQWSDKILKAIQSFKTEVPETAKQGRIDLRDSPFVTIDGEDARDFDDAVCCKATEKGWKLWVAIADVAHYVAINSALDIEAQNRSTSVYFPQQVIPMLPEILSNGLCSLNPKVDRLAMVCELLINQQGQIIRSQFFEAVICSKARLTYTEVATILQQPTNDLLIKYAELIAPLQELNHLYQQMRLQREQRGVLEFNSEESKIIFTENRKIAAIVPTERNQAHQLIEEFMISANIAAAKLLQRKKIPSLFRIHEGPNAEKLAQLRGFLGEMGLSLSGEDQPSAWDFMQVIRACESKPNAHLIQTVLLRSMSQAIYTPENKGHFGLALAAYSHFTSPIRRYPDLLVHRAIKHILTNKPIADFYYGAADMLLLGELCSANERRADEATRDVIQWLKCEFMQDKLGQCFDGIISTVTGFGLFVELKEIYVEGLIHISHLPADYFHFDAHSHQLRGEKTGLCYRLGDPVKIKVAQVNLDEKKIDFELIITRKKSPIKKKKSI